MQLTKDQMARATIMGAARALDGANLQLMVRKQPLLYCQPVGLDLNVDRLIILLQNFIGLHPDVSKQKVGMIGWALAQALEDEFPCSN
ncbi:hypothetical protein U8Q05_25825 [Rhizobium ruizarguesonis]|nr:hypothetical protein U8Q05_25825 [Rhizobium ruizarguesonis]